MWYNGDLYFTHWKIDMKVMLRKTEHINPVHIRWIYLSVFQISKLGKVFYKGKECEKYERFVALTDLGGWWLEETVAGEEWGTVEAQLAEPQDLGSPCTCSYTTKRGLRSCNRRPPGPSCTTTPRIPGWGRSSPSRHSYYKEIFKWTSSAPSSKSNDSL